MYTNQVWNLVEPLERIKAHRVQVGFQEKINMGGKVYSYKAKLESKGYH